MADDETLTSHSIFRHAVADGELADADDAELIAVVRDYDHDAPDGWASLSLNAMATFELRRRGYELRHTEAGTLRVYDPDGNPVDCNPGRS